MNKIIIFLLLFSSLFLLGCTESNITIPYTTSQFVNQSTDANYSVFKAGGYNNLCIVVDGNKLNFANCAEIVFDANLVGNQGEIPFVNLDGNALDSEAGFDYNAVTNTLSVQNIISDTFEDYLALNQTTPQTIINGKPIFDAGVQIGDFLTISDNGTNQNFELTSGDFVFDGGNIGIGTTAPTEKLEVNGNINLTGALRFSGNAGTNGQILQTTGSTAQWVATSTLGFASASSLNNYLLNTGDTATGDYTFGTDTLVIDSANNRVGVGTASPTTKLQINGTNGITSLDGHNLSLDTSGTTYYYPQFVLRNPDAHWKFQLNPGGSFSFQDMSTNYSVFRFEEGSQAFSFRTTSGEIILNDGGVDLDFRVESDTSQHALFVRGSDGYVGVNTTNPTERFVVNGNLLLQLDNQKILLGSGKDYSQYFDGANQKFELTSGDFVFNGGNVNITKNLTVDGNFYSKMPHLWGIATHDQSMNAINTWKAIDFNFLLGDNYGFTVSDSNGIVVSQTGHYFAKFETQFIDYSPAPDSEIGIRITKNGLEVPGSYSEVGSIRQDADVQIVTFAYVEAEAGDVLMMEWISNNIDVNLASNNLFSDQYVVAKGFINWVHPDGM